jgi:hypothetical protein
MKEKVCDSIGIVHRRMAMKNDQRIQNPLKALKWYQLLTVIAKHEYKLALIMTHAKYEADEVKSESTSSCSSVKAAF